MKMSTCVSAVSTKSSQGRLHSVSFDKERSVSLVGRRLVGLIEKPIAENFPLQSLEMNINSVRTHQVK